MKKIVLVSLVASLLLILSACQIKIEPNPNTEVAPTIQSVVLNGRVYREDTHQVATRPNDKFSLEVRAKNYNTLTLRVFKVLKGGKRELFATQSCGSSVVPCTLPFPAKRDWTEQDIGVYSVEVEAVNRNQRTALTYDDWVVVQLPTAQ